MINLETMKVAFAKAYGKGEQPILYFYSPGRVNLIGEHIDYNGGCVFPAALTLGIYGALRRRSDNLIVLRSTNASPTVTVDLSNPIENREQDGWANYPKGVIKGLLESKYILPGCDILFSGNLPDGTGLSSSAALLVLTAFMLQTASGEAAIDKVKLARFAQRIENQFIGVNCGIMDQFSVAMGKRDCAILLDCQSLQYKYIPFVLEKHSLVIMNTNKKRELTDSKYNERRSECEQALNIIQRYKKVDVLCQLTIDDIDNCLPGDLLRRRVRHVVSESNRVQLAVSLLQQGNIAGFAELMTQSHLSLKHDYEVTGPELDAIVDGALGAPGCLGARMTGGGFGGCAIALVETKSLPDFQMVVAEKYKAATGLIAEFYLAGIADGVSLLEG